VLKTGSLNMKSNMDDKKKALGESINEFSQFRLALTSESDRGCALFAAAYLDNALSKLLSACMVQGKRLEEDLFSGQAPLSTFSSRIKLAFYMGKIAESERKDLDSIRGIRNEFAHHPEQLTFENQSIRDRCANLNHNWRGKYVGPRTKFNATVSALLINIVVETIQSTSPNDKEERPMHDEVKQRGLALVAYFDEVLKSTATPCTDS